VDEFGPYCADDWLGAGMAMIEPLYNTAIVRRVARETARELSIDAMITKKFI